MLINFTSNCPFKYKLQIVTNLNNFPTSSILEIWLSFSHNVIKTDWSWVRWKEINPHNGRPICMEKKLSISLIVKIKSFGLQICFSVKTRTLRKRKKYWRQLSSVSSFFFKQISFISYLSIPAVMGNNLRKCSAWKHRLIDLEAVRSCYFLVIIFTIVDTKQSEYGRTKKATI